MNFSAADWCYYSKAAHPASYYTDLAKIGYRGVEMVDPSRYATARAAGLTVLNT